MLEKKKSHYSLLTILLHVSLAHSFIWRSSSFGNVSGDCVLPVWDTALYKFHPHSPPFFSYLRAQLKERTCTWELKKKTTPKLFIFDYSVTTYFTYFFNKALMKILFWIPLLSYSQRSYFKNSDPQFVSKQTGKFYYRRLLQTKRISEQSMLSQIYVHTWVQMLPSSNWMEYHRSSPHVLFFARNCCSRADWCCSNDM